MNTQYNLSNLEASFKQYLLTVNAKPLNSITIKNYLSDLRHFLGWIISDVRAHHAAPQHQSDPRKSASVSTEILPLIQAVTPTVVSDYKNYLNSNNIPPKTINRRLSTLRKFGSFCISQGWMKENPAKRIKNYELRIKNEKTEILTQYKEFLNKQNLDRQNITNLIADVEEFINLSKIVL